MNIGTRENEKNNKTKRIILYILIILFCIISIGLAIYIAINPKTIEDSYISKQEVKKKEEKTEDQILVLKENFNKLFSNKELDIKRETINKSKKEKNTIFTRFKIDEEVENKYEFKINIPYINIESETAKEMNKEIDKIFADKAREIVESKNTRNNTIYTVEYVANVKNDILSIMIKSSYKDAKKPQKVIIHTYNYDLKENKKIYLNGLIEKENLDKKKIQNKIKEEIKTEQKNSEELYSCGYNVYVRDSNSNIYNIENTTEFYITETEIYLIYPYGNTNETSEMDIVIL